MSKQKPSIFAHENERQFEADFLIPKLRQLGYSIYSQYHGPHGTGKDVIISDADRFGLLLATTRFKRNISTSAWARKQTVSYRTSSKHLPCRSPIR